MVVDSIGLKLHGEGEWKVKKYGKEKRCGWLKLHLAIYESSNEIEASLLTGYDVHDCVTLLELINQIKSDIEQVTGDGAYNTHGSYAVAIDKNAKPSFPSRKNATRSDPKDEAYRLRNHALSQVGYHDLAYWK